MNEAEVQDAYRRYGHLVRARCLRIMREPASADDATQEAFVRLWRYGESFREASSKLAWLYRVAERCCFDLIARRRGDVALDQAPAATDLGPSVAQVLEDREIVMSFLARFDDRVKQVAVLHYLDETTQPQISVATGWSRQTVHSKLVHLRERAQSLRESLAGGRR